MRAESGDGLGPEWRGRLLCEQSFKPAADALSKAGFRVAQRLDGAFPMGLCLITKHKAETLANIARAWTLLEPGGVLVCCGAKALGGASIEREVERVFGLDGQMSKHQARVFWFHRDGDMPPILTEWLAAGGAMAVGDSGFVARSGCFSSGHVDRGSAVLAECFPEGMAGRVADLGAGWGYLSVDLLRRFPAVTGIDLYEAEALALEDAGTNMAALAPADADKASFHWLDVCAGLPEVAPYDWIIANPPFHEGRKADPAMGKAFITSAWRSIRRRGKFLLVANQTLPYEADLRRRFREVTLLTQKDGFKVYLSSNRHDR
ncbi:class I SAM-dependent methyltransferase [Paramagnetospirillum kuznetsovii]|uniref:Class I SAM-dependent methyltransferase n=2 Tax=Paramagnetospirillum kuznetsovii TaxID=2053833 RepID=A0A364P064_9PROT|nr:class I SAM-dependent methyltransferase [Paramagnetospirillum kuznetsovii]